MNTRTPSVVKCFWSFYIFIYIMRYFSYNLLLNMSFNRCIESLIFSDFVTILDLCDTRREGEVENESANRLAG